MGNAACDHNCGLVTSTRSRRELVMSVGVKSFFREKYFKEVDASRKVVGSNPGASKEFLITKSDRCTCKFVQRSLLTIVM